MEAISASGMPQAAAGPVRDVAVPIFSTPVLVFLAGSAAQLPVSSIADNANIKAKPQNNFPDFIFTLPYVF
jgi:hypothetical protein